MFVADIAENFVVYRHRSVFARKRNSRISHKTHKPQRFHRYRFSAGVRTGDKQNRIPFADADRNRYDFVFIYQGMARFYQICNSGVCQKRLNSVRFFAKNRFREYYVTHSYFVFTHDQAFKIVVYSF